MGACHDLCLRQCGKTVWLVIRERSAGNTVRSGSKTRTETGEVRTLNRRKCAKAFMGKGEKNCQWRRFRMTELAE